MLRPLHRPRRPGLAAIAVALGACVVHPPSSAPRHTPLDVPSLRDGPARAQGSATPDPSLRPDLEALLLARERFFDPRGTAGGVPWVAGAARRVTPPGPRVSLPVRASLAAARVARIDAFAFSRVETGGPSCSVDEEPTTRDGHLCGDVRLPAATLSRAETARVVGLLTSAEARDAEVRRAGGRLTRAVLRCGNVTHHALVLFDATDHAIGKILVGIGCGEWKVLPASSGAFEGTFQVTSPEERATLRDVLAAHDLGVDAVDDARLEDLGAYVSGRYGTESEPTALGLARKEARLRANPTGLRPDARVAALSEAERKTLCGWIAHEARPARRAPQGADESHGYACEDGTGWVVSHTSASCWTTPLPCTKTVAEVEACLRTMNEAQFLCLATAGTSGPCADPALRACFPGVRRAP